MSEPSVMTVRGPVPASSLGTTLMHEHIMINMQLEFRLDGLLNDVPLAVQELGCVKDAGGGTVVDVTTNCFGRQPEALRRISEMSGLHIVMGSGLYRHQYFDAAWVDRTSTNELADWIVGDLTKGVGTTGVKAGIIGESGCDEWITAQEERSLRAAARAHKKTGVAITTHAARWPVGHLILDILEEEGVDLHRVIVGHCDFVASVNWTSRNELTDYQESLARRGVFVQFDTMRHTGRVIDEYFQRRVDYVRNMIAKGFVNQVLLSQDVAFRSTLRAGGGSGYAFLLTDFLPMLKAGGVSAEAIHIMTVENPRRILGV